MIMNSHDNGTSRVLQIILYLINPIGDVKIINGVYRKHISNLHTLNKAGFNNLLVLFQSNFIFTRVGVEKLKKTIQNLIYLL